MLKQIKIGLIILFLSTLSYAQDGATLLTLMSDDASYDADAQAYFDAMSTPLSTDYQDRINTFVLMVKDSLSLTNLSDKFDVIYLLANETSEAGLKNLVKRSSDATIGAETVTFTADEGFAGDGVGGYINTNYNANSDGVNYILNDASFGIYSRTNSQSTVIDIGGRATDATADAIWIVLRYTNDSFYGSLNNAIALNSAVPTSAGFGLMSRAASDNAVYYFNGGSIISNSDPAVSIFDGDIFICTENRGGSPVGYTSRQYAFAFMGAGLDAVEARKLNNCIEWYMDDLGTGVE